jgi:hypothetical protein
MEKFLGVFEDGPYPGTYEFPDDEVTSWPLPKFIRAKFYDKGYYVKYWESAGNPASEDEARGAKYKWDESSVGKGLSK